jgi:penicillin-insensitive murein DD-endopeptidase
MTHAPAVAARSLRSVVYTKTGHLNPSIMKLWLIIPVLIPLTATAGSNTSICYGTTSKGHLENGVQLRESGSNFESYSRIAGILGRTYVHSVVKDIILEAYQKLSIELPGKVYKYAETGFKQGGKFKPHKTHQNGLSVDFITPVIDAHGQSVQLPTNLLNKYGYDIEFDKKGRYDGLTIDYQAMAAHIVQLHQAAKARGHDLWRVIFDPALQAGLFKTQYAAYLKDNIKFSKKRSWVRHDEHYHVDFIVPCKTSGS